MMNYSLALNGGIPTSPNGNTVSSPTDSLASSNNPLCLQGDKYLFGYGVPKSYDQAFKCYQTAASSSSSKQQAPEALNMLGCMFEHGLGQPVDIRLAIDHYKKAAQIGSADAWNNLGRINETAPNGQPRDYQEAVNCYVKAAKLGHVDAMVNLGFLAENGLINNSGNQAMVDLVKAEEWYRAAAEKNYARAQNCLGALLYRQSQKDKEAFEYLKKAADQGNAHGMNNLAICYEEGRGTDKNMEMAKKYYRQSMELNHPSGTNNYAYLLLNEKKYMEAAKFFNVAVALGSVDALYNLGTLYEAGALHPSKRADLEMARFYYQEAAAKGHSAASKRATTI